MTPRDLAPHDAELIAAFIDKRLSEEERKAFLERLDQDEALYEVFVETVRYREQGMGAGGELIEPAVWRKKWFLPAAVAALVAMAGATVVLIRGVSEESYAEMLVADGRLDPYLTEGWYEQPWSEMRGPASGLSEAEAAFRVGVVAADLEVALRSGRPDDAIVLSRRIETLLREIEFSEPLRALFSELRNELETATHAAGSNLRPPEDSTLEEYFGDLADDFRLGKWVEAGRLAAQSGNAGVLASSRFRSECSSLGNVERNDRADDRLERIGSLLVPTAAVPFDFALLERQFLAMIEDG